MKRILAATAIMSVTATAAFANPNYPLEVIKDGTIYNCEAQVNIVDGVKSRSCLRVGGVNEAGGGLFTGGLGAIGIVAGLAAVIAISVIALDDDDDATIGTQ